MHKMRFKKGEFPNAFRQTTKTLSETNEDHGKRCFNVSHLHKMICRVRFLMHFHSNSSTTPKISESS